MNLKILGCKVYYRVLFKVVKCDFFLDFFLIKESIIFFIFYFFGETSINYRCNEAMAFFKL